MYVITRKDGTISGVNPVLYQSIRDAERDIRAEFTFDNPAYNYVVEKSVETREEVTYNVYVQDLYRRNAVGELRYLAHVIRMELA